MDIRGIFNHAKWLYDEVNRRVMVGHRAAPTQ